MRASTISTIILGIAIGLVAVGARHLRLRPTTAAASSGSTGSPRCSRSASSRSWRSWRSGTG